jgi:hypothetical protein
MSTRHLRAATVALAVAAAILPGVTAARPQEQEPVKPPIYIVLPHVYWHGRGDDTQGNAQE